ncbi:hypothetical protein [Streptomyces sp.]|uniref:hypothetical protein n=1 Tax=Streptomyces sp. TaxID=1931 RepID=UPI002F42CE88
MVRKGGVVVTCGSSTGYQHEFGNRCLWMNLKRVVGSHAASLQEQSECNRLFGIGMLSLVLSGVYPLQEGAEAARTVQLNRHVGKLGVLCLEPAPGDRSREAGADRCPPSESFSMNVEKRGFRNGTARPR